MKDWRAQQPCDWADPESEEDERWINPYLIPAISVIQLATHDLNAQVKFSRTPTHVAAEGGQAEHFVPYPPRTFDVAGSEHGEAVSASLHATEATHARLAARLPHEVEAVMAMASGPRNYRFRCVHCNTTCIVAVHNDIAVPRSYASAVWQVSILLRRRREVVAQLNYAARSTLASYPNNLPVSQMILARVVERLSPTA
jgi:hypothetical protein